MNGPAAVDLVTVTPLYWHYKQKLSVAPAATPAALVVLTPVVVAKVDKVDESTVEPQVAPERANREHEPAEVAAVGTVLAQFADPEA